MTRNMTTTNHLPTDYQTFIATSRYARWIEEENRRETWAETVGRFIDNIVRPADIDNGLEGEWGEYKRSTSWHAREDHKRSVA